ncbi:hypothetical protein GEMMAAP_13475 [Gemmatimonas phototrophica]|uniref:Uncharacterized protein n=1 Tax=Gemmatimonas phototrophica TaxID=1379270 RepID=A0A143BKK4_9BACT|nr:hypothetical protein GEMMAAP_13475 [Gemmatimonas phototrophica]
MARTWWGAWRNFRIPAEHVANVEADLRFASGLNWWVTTLLFIGVLTWGTEAFLLLLPISLVSTVVQVWYPMRRVGQFPVIEIDRSSLRPYN